MDAFQIPSWLNLQFGQSPSLPVGCSTPVSGQCPYLEAILRFTWSSGLGDFHQATPQARNKEAGGYEVVLIDTNHKHSRDQIATLPDWKVRDVSPPKTGHPRSAFPLFLTKHCRNSRQWCSIHRASPLSTRPVNGAHGQSQVYPSASNVVLLTPEHELVETLQFWLALPHRASSSLTGTVAGVLCSSDDGYVSRQPNDVADPNIPARS